MWKTIVIAFVRVVTLGDQIEYEKKKKNFKS
jgi:hypothetical protein